MQLLNMGKKKFPQYNSISLRSLDADRSPSIRTIANYIPNHIHPPSKSKIQFRSIEVDKIGVNHRLNKQKKTHFSSRSCTQKKLILPQDNKYSFRYSPNYNVLNSQQKNIILPEPCQNLKKVMKIKLNRKRKNIKTDMRNNSKQNQIEENIPSFEHYLKFMKDDKRVKKIQFLKQNRKGWIRQNQKIPSRVFKQSESQSRIQMNQESRESEIDQCSTILQINQSSFLSEAGKNIFDESVVNAEMNCKKKHIERKKGHAAKSIDRIKYAFPKGFFNR